METSNTCISSAQLTPCSRVLPEKLTVPHLLNKFPVFHGTQKFITTFITARHVSLSWTTSIHSKPPPPPCPHPEPHPSLPSPPPPPSHFSKIHFNIILPSTPESPQVASFLQVSPQISSVQLILILRWWKDFWKIYRPLSVKVYRYYTIRDQKLKVVGEGAISYRNTTFYDPLLGWLFTDFGS